VNLDAPESPTERSPASSRSSRSWVWSAVGIMRRHGWLRPRRIGCLLIVLVIAAMWLVGRVVDGFNSLFSPPPVAGNPLSTVSPPRPASSGSPVIDRITRRGRLIVAVQETPGLAQRSLGAGGYTGFDIALLDLIAHDLAVDPAWTSFKPLPAGTREAALARGEVDLVLGGYEITATPNSAVGVAGPYLVRPLLLAIPQASSVSSVNSLRHGAVCAPAGSPAVAALVSHGVAVQTRATLDACANLLDGRVEAIAADQVTLAGTLSRAPRTLRVLDEQLGSTEYGIGLPAGDPVLHDRITAVLRRTIENGTWARLYAQYLGNPVPKPPALR
jgi:ABC-type amino acid transport substrate-binding protein